MKPIEIIDEPCGTGKTTQMIRSLNPEKKYLIIVPYLSEVQRIIENADQINLFQPDEKLVYEQTKQSHFQQLLKQGKSVVTTHSLYENAVNIIREGLVLDYHIIIDEVLNAAEVIASKSPQSLKDFYFQTNYLTLDKDGRVKTSWNWAQHKDEVSDTLDAKIFRVADFGQLFLEGGKNFITGIPRELLCAGQSLTIMTFMFQGSLLRAYLDKLRIPYKVRRDIKAELQFRERARELIEVRTITPLENINLSHSGQAKGLRNVAYQNTFNNGLRNLRYKNLQDVAHEKILITTRKDIWFKKGDNKLNIAGPCAKCSRFFGANWIANTSRGTNNYSHCSTLLYLYDQHVNPTIARWLGVSGTEFNDKHALTELIQWVWRSRIRNGEPITLYLPSKRMKMIFSDFLETDLWC